MNRKVHGHNRLHIPEIWSCVSQGACIGLLGLLVSVLSSVKQDMSGMGQYGLGVHLKLPNMKIVECITSHGLLAEEVSASVGS
jgi:hypothetical protein